MAAGAALALGLGVAVLGAPALTAAQDGPDQNGARPDPKPGCVSLEYAQARQTFPPNRIALYTGAGGWLGDIVVAESCPPLVPQAHIYVAEKNKQWGKICSREGPENTQLWVQDTRCPVAGVVDARSFEGEPPDPIAPELNRATD